MKRSLLAELLCDRIFFGVEGGGEFGIPGKSIMNQKVSIDNIQSHVWFWNAGKL